MECDDLGVALHRPRRELLVSPARHSQLFRFRKVQDSRRIIDRFGERNFPGLPQENFRVF